jgi:acylglycerol lipase
VQHAELGWQTSDGLQVFGQLWQPEVPARAVVCLVHGLGEHSGRYTHVAAALTEAGFGMLGFDLRGHGQSQGQRGHTPSWGILLDDIAQALEQGRERFGDCPQFLYGHSLGGTLVLNYGVRARPNLAGVIATGPLLRPAFDPSAWKLSLGRLMYKVWPGFSMNNELDTTGVSRDAAVVKAYVNDPLVHDRISARMALDMLECGEWLLQHASEFDLPLLLMHGGADRLCSPQAVREFADRVDGECTYHGWEGLYHEVHNEPEQRSVFQVMIDWLNAHTQA